jgi:hypothetical protein
MPYARGFLGRHGCEPFTIAECTIRSDFTRSDFASIMFTVRSKRSLALELRDRNQITHEVTGAASALHMATKVAIFYKGRSCEPKRTDYVNLC